jgi:hypothetical protein
MTEQDVIKEVKKIHPDIVLDAMAIRICQVIAKPLEDRIKTLEREVNWLDWESRKPKISDDKN